MPVFSKRGYVISRAKTEKQLSSAISHATKFMHQIWNLALKLLTETQYLGVAGHDPHTSPIHYRMLGIDIVIYGLK